MDLAGGARFSYVHFHIITAIAGREVHITRAAVVCCYLQQAGKKSMDTLLFKAAGWTRT